jgi:hypothetical protein
VIQIRLRHLLGMGLVLALVGGGIWFFVEGTENSAVGAGGLPLIKADTNPVKLPPDDPGGEVMPNADSTVFTAMGADETRDPSMENLKIPATPKPEGASADFAGLNTGFNVPQAPEKKVESLFANGAVSSEPMERPAREAAEVAAENAAQPKGDYETGQALDMASDAPAPESQPEPAQPVPAPKPVADNTPAPPAPTPIVNADASAAQNQEAQEKAIAKDDAAEETTASAPAAGVPPVPPSKPGADKKPESPKAAAPAPAPASKDTAGDAQKTVAQDVANEAYRHHAAPSAAQPGYYMQLASTPSKEEAPRLWARLTKKYPNALAGLSPTYQTAAVPGKGDYIRVQAGPLTQDQASARCRQLHAVNPKGGCLVFKR